MRPKVYVSRSLAELPPLPELFADIQTVSLQEVGQTPFVDALLAASQGDPFETSTPESAPQDFQALISYAGSAFDPSRWLMLKCGGEVLPQFYADKPQVGTLFYLGVLPAYRGKGLGRALHLLGLHHLQSYGVTEYP